ncbi:MAG: class II aldolase/adducin family protein [Sphaerochaetaceae bacterium]
MQYENIREQIVHYAKRMYEEKMVSCTSGNISIRLDDRSDAFAITPGSENYMTLTSDRIVIICLDGQLLYCPEGAKPSSEWRMHAEVYRAKADVRAIVHTHSPYATAFAVLGESVPTILSEMIFWLGGDVPLAKYGKPGTAELGIKALECLENRYACLLANHGVLAVADNLDLAYTRAAYVEDANKIYHLARCVGKPTLVPDSF